MGQECSCQCGDQKSELPFEQVRESRPLHLKPNKSTISQDKSQPYSFDNFNSLLFRFLSKFKNILLTELSFKCR